MDILINGTVVDALSCIVHTDKAVQSGRSLCAKLKNVIPKYVSVLCLLVIIAANSMHFSFSLKFKNPRKPVGWSLTAHKLDVLACHSDDLWKKRLRDEPTSLLLHDIKFFLHQYLRFSCFFLTGNFLRW